ncbi:MAG TPA: tetratricopeptide repeat protein [Thermoanaerobaculia bacterium]|nr:tetratricopeptide repeat protein [Thermoanaerobaculia bacterium]
MRADAPFGPFANREREVAALAQLLTTAASPLTVRLWSAQPATGVTAWLRYFRKLRCHDAVVLYLDAADGVANSLFGSIYVALRHDYREHWTVLEQALRRTSGASPVRQLSAALASSIPYVGAAAERALQLSDLPVNPTYYPSLPAEAFSRALGAIASRTPVVLLVDNAQDLDDGSYDLLASTAGGAARIHYELAYVHRDPAATARFATTVHRLEHLGYTVRVESLPPLSADAVERWATLVESRVAAANAPRVLAESGGNVYYIARRLRDDAALAGVPPASPVAATILQYLAVARQSLRISDLTLLLTRPHAPVFGPPGAVDAEVRRLVASGELQEVELPDGDALVRPLHTTPVAISDRVVEARCAVALYDYYIAAQQTSLRHAPAEVLPLLYRLSKLAAPDDTPAHAQELLRLSLAMGSSRAAEGLIRNATLPSVDATFTFVDYIVRIAALMATRRYREASALLQVPPRAEWACERLVRVLLAIALNRCREHAASERLIGALLTSSSSLEEQVLLLSYSIAGKLHDGDVRGARDVYEAHGRSVERATNVGYLLRNAAAAMEPEDALALLTRAVERFAETGDTFGWASSRSNRGNNLALLGRLGDAQDDFEAAHDQLQTYGAVHLHVVLNNLGIVALLRGDLSSAREFLKRARTNAENATPRALAGINLCVALAASGDTAGAAALLLTLEEEAASAAVDRVRQRFYPNAFILSMLLGFARPQQDAYYERALAFPDRSRPASVFERLGRARREGVTHETLRELMVPAFLAYWYQNPLEMLPLHLLAEQARSEE